jgi:hypothetical protein
LISASEANPTSLTTSSTPELPLATRDDLLGRFRRRYDFAVAPVMGKRFRLQNLNELERSRVENSILNNKGRIRGDRLLQIKARWIQATAVDGDGNLFYSERDVPTIAGQDSQDVDALMEAIKRHVGIKDDDLEDMEKNSGRTSDGDSP